MVLPEREDPECAANRRRRCRYAAREGTALPCRMSPTFLLSCQKKSRRHSGGKGNRLGMSWPPMGQHTQNGGLAVTNCRPNPEVSYRLRYTYSFQNCVPAPAGTEYNGVQNRIGVFLLPCVPLRYALPGPFPVLSSSLALRPLGGWFFLPRPSSPGGGSKGESTKAPPGADKAARFRGNGTIGGPSGLGIVLP